MKYAASVTINAASIIPKLGGIMQELNDTMKSFGVDEAVQARTEIGEFTIQSDMELPFDKLEEIRAQAEAIAMESHPTWNFKFGRLKRTW